MMYLGDFVSGATIDFLFTTVRSTGLPTAISGPGAAVYKDNSAVESRSGLTLTTNFDAMAGLHLVRISTTSGTFYTSGSDYSVVMISGRVNGVAIRGLVVSRFSLQNRVVDVRSGQLSGHVIDLLSGRSYTASGIFATATATVTSGEIYLASGHFLFGSGTYFIASGSITSGVIVSGVFVNASVSVSSGTTYLASGHFQFGSGQYFIASGSITSGVVASGIYVTTPIASVSGTNVVVPIATLSGTVIASGANVTVPIATISGANSVIPIATISGVVPNVLSGLVYPPSGALVLPSGGAVNVLSGNLSGQVVTAASGAFVTALALSGASVTATVYSGQLSGQILDLLSGRSYVASGIPAATFSGTTYLPSGALLINTFASGVMRYVGDLALIRNLSGMETSGAKQSLLAAALKLSSRFNARSGSTYQADGTTVFMTQTPTLASGMTPIGELGVGA